MIFRIATPIRVACRVLDQSPHSIIVGEGAQQFAISQGFSVSQLKLESCSKICRAMLYRVAHKSLTVRFCVSKRV